MILLDSTSLELTGKRSLLVRPTRSQVSPFCTELTTITPDMVEAAMSLQQACDVLAKEYKRKKRLWASYGDYDRTMMMKSCEALNVTYPFGQGHLNVKTLAAILLGRKSESGLGALMSSLGMRFEGTQHRGHDDAENIGRVLKYLIEKTRQ